MIAPTWPCRTNAPHTDGLLAHLQSTQIADASDIAIPSTSPAICSTWANSRRWRTTMERS